MPRCIEQPLSTPDYCTFEYDDYPLDAERFLAAADAIKQLWPGFCCTVFAIPGMMTAKHWDEILRRDEWMHAAPHGFEHAKRECRDGSRMGAKLRALDRIAGDKRWARLFKPPWYGTTAEFIESLHSRGFALVAKTFRRVPYPCPAHWRWWNVLDPMWARGWAWSEAWHVESHPRINSRKARRTAITDRNLSQWCIVWQEAAAWKFAADLVRPMLVKLNIPCGECVKEGWVNLDFRTGLDPRISPWRWPDQIPYSDNHVDVAVVSHFFEYLSLAEYQLFLLDLWRVLRPGAVLRIGDIETAHGFVWRKPGEPSRGTGELKSLPTRGAVSDAARAVGFGVHDAKPGITLSPHADAVELDTRALRYRRAQKFYIECVKTIDIPDEGRSRHYDFRGSRVAFYRLPSDGQLYRGGRLWDDIAGAVRRSAGRDNTRWDQLRKILPAEEQTT